MKYKSKQKKKAVMFALFVNLFFVMTLLLYMPVESYIGGASDFWFAFLDILPAILITAGAAFVILMSLAFLLPWRISKFISGLLFAFGFCSYLQVNFFNPNYGLLGASEINWSSFSVTAYIYAGIWGILLILVPVLCVVTKKDSITTALKSVAGLLTIMQTVSLVVLLMTNLSMLEPEKDSVLTTDEMLTAGKEEGSITVFILDTMDNLYFEDALATEPQLKSVFDGFTVFSNSTGSYTKTWGSVSYILTGIPCLNESTYDEYCASAYRDSKLFKTLRNENYDIRVFTDLPDEHITPYVDNAGASATVITDMPILYMNFLKYVGFRTMPELVKENLYMDSYSFNTLQSSVAYNSQWVCDDPYFFRQVKEQGVSAVDGKTFRFYHLNGAHAPTVMDEYGNVSETATVLQQSIGSIRILENYFAQMKEKGIYDSTTIMILGDHSRYKNSESIFIVKPANSRGEVNYSNAPVCHADVHNTLFDLVGLPQVDYGMSAFQLSEDEERERKGWLYFAEEMWNYQPSYLPPLWEVTYGYDNMAPYYTGTVYDSGKKLTLADVALTIEYGKTYGYDDLQQFFPVDSLIWGDAAEGYKFLNMRQGKLFFRVPSLPDKELTMKLSFIKWMPISENRLRIACNGQTLFDETFHGSMEEEVCFAIPTECIDPNTGLVSLDIYSPNAVMRSDHRLFTAGLLNITVE